MIKARQGDTPATLAQRLLGDARLTHEIFVVGHHGEGEVTPGTPVYLRSEKMGPPSRHWAKGNG